MKIIFYGRLAQSFGRELEFEAGEGCSVARLRERLSAEHPDVAESLGRRTRALVADTVVADSYVLKPGDDVEFFPPVSGG